MQFLFLLVSFNSSLNSSKQMEKTDRLLKRPSSSVQFEFHEDKS